MESKKIREYVNLLVQDEKENPTNRTFTIINVPKEYRAAVGRELRKSFGGNKGDAQLAKMTNTIAMSIPVISGGVATPAMFNIADLAQSALSGDIVGALLSATDIIPGNPIQKYLTSKKIYNLIDKTSLERSIPSNLG